MNEKLTKCLNFTWYSPEKNNKMTEKLIKYLNFT